MNNEIDEVVQVNLERKTKTGESRRRLDEALEQRTMRYYTDEYYFGNDSFSAIRDESPNHDIFE